MNTQPPPPEVQAALDAVKKLRPQLVAKSTAEPGVGVRAGPEVQAAVAQLANRMQQAARARMLVSRKRFNPATGRKDYQAGVELHFPDGSRNYKWLRKAFPQMSRAVAYGAAVIERHSRLRMVETKPSQWFFKAWALLGKLRPWIPPKLTKWTEAKLMAAGKRSHERKEREREARLRR
jgi:hypothetical protein